MNSLRVATRGAVPAAFLLFAAGLLGVGPAEASRTTTDARPDLSSASSEALASPSLELSLLEPIDSAESSPRFGFGEDLGLLDPEAGPGGFVVFARETSRCELTYARNNPVTFIDPTGLKTEDGRVTAEVDAVDPDAASREESRRRAEESRRRAELELRMMRLGTSSLRAKAADIVDRAAFQFVSGLGHVVVGAANDDPGEIAEGLFQHSLLVFGEAGYLIGAEVKIGRNFRLAPFGNRTGHPTGKFPHFHRRVVRPDGSTLPGGAIGRHRPWDAPPKGTPWWKFWRRF